MSVAQACEASEVAVRGDELATMFDREGGVIGVTIRTKALAPSFDSPNGSIPDARFVSQAA